MACLRCEYSLRASLLTLQRRTELAPFRFASDHDPSLDGRHHPESTLMSAVPSLDTSSSTNLDSPAMHRSASVCDHDHRVGRGFDVGVGFTVGVDSEVGIGTGGVELNSLIVERHDGIISLQSLAGELDAVNEGSAKPSPFATSAFTITYASNSERDPLGMDVRLFVVRDGGGRAVGWAVFAFRVDELLTTPAIAMERSAAIAKLVTVASRCSRASRLELMTTSDVDRPGIVARHGYEDVVAKALLTHLVEHERDWTMLEWRAQEREAPLWRAAHEMAGPLLRVRDVELDPYSEVSLQWRTVEAYFHSLSKRMRSNVSRQARKLYASGDVGLLMVEGPEATAAFFDAYLELETRSWKHQSAAAVSRHPLRKKFYSKVVSGQAGIEPSMIGVTLDGVLIAALINGRFGDRMWSMEMAFDESFNELGPGQLLLLLAVMDGVEKNCRSLNFFQLHGYFKRRWLADEFPVVNVQLIRRPSLHHVRALLGDALRWGKVQLALRTQRVVARRSHKLGKGEPGAGVETEAVESDTSDGGFNAMKRAGTSAKPGEPSVSSGQNPSESADEAIARRALFSLALHTARGVRNENITSVRIFDAAESSAILPFAIR